ncbi:MAG: MalY/PatB family protein [Ignavibacteriales bacterium]
MRYDFDRVINRYNTASEKWDGVQSQFGEKDLLPMWVADMDFSVPEPVTEALRKRVEHGVYGYTRRPDSYFEAIVDWMERRHGWAVRREWICHSPRVMTALSCIVQSFTQPGDKVVIQSPVYHPFARVVLNNGRRLVRNQLLFENDRYSMDLDDLRESLDSGAKMLILCSPHNPVGRVWTRDELEELGDICLEHNVLVISDEVHADIVFKGHVHTPFASVSEEFSQNTMVCTGPSKTFNLAGMCTSNVIIPNEDLRQAFLTTMDRNNLLFADSLGLVAAESAYRYGEEWFEQLLEYLRQNLEFLTKYISKNIHGIKVIEPEGTYLVWLDCRGLGMDARDLERFFLKKAGVAMNQGYIFGPGGEGFVRMNIACPRSLLLEGLRRIEEAVRSLQGFRKLGAVGEEDRR